MLCPPPASPEAQQSSEFPRGHSEHIPIFQASHTVTAGPRSKVSFLGLEC